MRQMNVLAERRTWIALLLLGAMIGSVGLLNDRVAVADDAHEKIEEAMETINTHYKMLRREARKGEYGEETVQRLKEMQIASIEAMHYDPPMISKVADDKKKQFVIDYKKSMAAMTNHYMQMEITYLEGNLEKFGEMIDQMGDIKSDGHDKFTAE